MILVLDPHGDDGIVAAGGTLSKLSGQDIHYVVFSLSKKSVPDKFPLDIIRQENNEAMKVLGIKTNAILDFPVREFLDFRQNILEYLIALNQDMHPDAVYMPSRFDTHQDHKVICEEGIRAFKKTSSLYGFDMPWNTMDNHIHRFEVLEKQHIDKKVEAINCFKSQLVKGNKILEPEKIKAFATSRGSIVNQEHAEAFEVIREVIM